MRRYLPVARQHFLAALAGTSVVVKSLSAAVLLLYLLSFGLDTAYGLGVTPGYLLPPNFWVWTLLTHGLVEERAWGLAASLATLGAAGRLLEPLWGALELLVFFTVVNVSVGLLGALAYFLTYVASFHLAYLFTVRIHGGLGFLGGVLVALKQTMGDSTVLKVPQVRMKAVPMLLLLLLALLRLAALIKSNVLASYGFGLLSGWVYLRFYQRHSRGRGDMSDHFAFATFFPEILQPVVGLVANLVHGILVKVKVCRKTVKRYDVGAPSSITISLPGTDPQDAERRRYRLPCSCGDHVYGWRGSGLKSKQGGVGRLECWVLSGGPSPGVCWGCPPCHRDGEDISGGLVGRCPALPNEERQWKCRRGAGRSWGGGVRGTAAAGGGGGCASPLLVAALHPFILAQGKAVGQPRAPAFLRARHWPSRLPAEKFGQGIGAPLSPAPFYAFLLPFLEQPTAHVLSDSL